MHGVKGKFVDIGNREVKMLLDLAKSRSERDWEIFSYMVGSGKRLSEVAEIFEVQPKTIMEKFRLYSKLLGFTITPHKLQRFFASRLQWLGASPRGIGRLLGHKLT